MCKLKFWKILEQKLIKNIKLWNNKKNTLKMKSIF